MMKNILFPVFVFASLTLKAQDDFNEYNQYPAGQYPYKGGEAAFYKDFMTLLQKTDFSPVKIKKRSTI